jgi:soluble lytic murein transglycosylase
LALRLVTIAGLIAAVACEQGGSAVAIGQAPLDSAATVWVARAQQNAEVASWMYLRAAAATPDSAVRRELYARVTLPLAQQRISWVEAAARATFGDSAGALKAYNSLAAPVTTLKLRAAVFPASRDSVRRALVSFIASTSSRGSVSEATALFDSLFGTPSAAEQLAIARASARAGLWQRASDAFGAIRLSELDAQDRFSYASVLARLNSDQKAATVYATVTSPASLAGAARYQRARALLADGNGAGARASLRSLAKSAPDTNAAAALSLLADLQVDDGNDAGSRATLLDLAHRFPKSRFAAPAQFDAALIALILGNAKSARTEFAKLAAGSAAEALAAQYWLGRAYQLSGDTAAAQTAWRDVLRRDSTSYYSTLAASRLGVQSMHSSRAAGTARHIAAVDSALRRVSLLQQFGMSAEARFENDELFRTAQADSTRLLATAHAFAGTDQAARAIALGRLAITRFGSTPDVWRLVYPAAARDTIVEASKKADLDPTLVAALIRQESNFNPGARSAVGARGLMQVMPAVGKAMAPSLGITDWNPDILYDPGINIEFGVQHLAPLVRSQSSIVRTLAAYNAGASRVKRWATRRGADDPEIFTERIPFAETKDYVKSVLRNRAFYRALYAW